MLVSGLGLVQLTPHPTIRFETPFLGLAGLVLATIYLLLALRAFRARRLLLAVYSLDGRVFAKRLQRTLLVLGSRAAAAYIIAFAAAGPVLVTIDYVDVEAASTEQLYAIPVTLHIFVDVSPSMKGGRAEAAAEFLKTLLSSLTGNDRAYMYTFAARVEGPHCSILRDCINFTYRLPGITGLEKYSAVGDAILAAASAVSAGPSAAIVVTDGGWNYGSRPEDAVKYAAGKPIILVIVGDDPRAYRVVEAAEEAGLRVYHVFDNVQAVIEALQVHVEARRAALTFSGYTRIPMEKAVSLTHVFTGLAVALLLASRLEGV